MSNSVVINKLKQNGVSQKSIDKLCKNLGGTKLYVSKNIDNYFLIAECGEKLIAELKNNFYQKSIYIPKYKESKNNCYSMIRPLLNRLLGIKNGIL